MMKTLKKLGTGDNFLHLIRLDIYKKHTANIIFCGERQDALPPNIKKKARMTPLITSVQHS